ncbi:MAG: hypothetical protein ABH872_06345 [Candidatus Omnitrophota bacterium]
MQTELLRTQVLVSNSLAISQIGDRCMWYAPHGGDYDSYLLLKAMKEDPINKDMIKAIENQIKRVEDKYKSTNVMIDNAKNIAAIMRFKDSPEEKDAWAKIDTVKVSNIFNHIKEHLPSEQIKAAYFISGVTSKRLQESKKTWEDVFEILIWAINNETWCLYGRKMALIAYCQLAEKQFPNKVFAFKEATDDWKNRRAEILTKKKNSSIGAVKKITVGHTLKGWV